MKSLQPALDVKADRIYDAVSSGKCGHDRLLILNVGLHGLKLRIIRAKQPISLIRMPRCDPNGKVAVAQMPNDAAAKKASPAEYGDGATVRCHLDSNPPLRVSTPHCLCGHLCRHHASPAMDPEAVVHTSVLVELSNMTLSI
jgi:hypothetical protein